MSSLRVILLGLVILGISLLPGCSGADDPSAADASGGPSAEQQEAKPSKVEQDLQTAWELRDELEGWDSMSNRQFEDDQWSPVEYAPYLWRRLNATLLDLDLRARGEPSLDREEQGILQSQVRTMKALRDRSSTSTGEAIGTAAADFYADKAARTSFLQPGLKDTTGQEVRYFYRLVYRVRDYLNWHDQLGQLANDDIAPLQGELHELLVVLKEIREELDAFHNKRADPGMQDRVTRQIQECEQLRRKIETLIDEQIKYAVEHAAEPQHQVRVERILASPLCSARQRTQLKVAMKDREKRDKAAETKQRRLDRGDSRRLQEVLDELPSSHRRNEFWKDQFKLEQALWAVVAGPNGEVEASETEDLRSAGRHLLEQLQGLPQAIGPAESPMRADLLLRVADPRDHEEVERVVRRNWRFPRLWVQAPVRDLQLQLVAPRDLPLRTNLDEWQTVKLRVTLPTDQAEITVTPKGNQDVKFGSASQVPRPLEGVEYWEFPIMANLAASEFQRGQSGRLRFVATCSFEGESLSAEPLDVPYRLPRPDQIQLMVKRVRPPRRQEPRIFRDENSIRLRPFPNRTTEFRCYLKNLSDTEHKVDVRLMPMRRLDGATIMPGRVMRFVDNEGAKDEYLRPLDAVIVAEAVKVTLPPHPDEGPPESVPITFKNASDGAEPSPEGSAEGSEPTSPRKSPAVDVSHGLLCEITSNTTQRTWKKWIEIEPLRPYEYLKVESAYSDETETVTVTVRAADEDRDGVPDPDQALPADLIGDPEDPQSMMVVNWDHRRHKLTENAEGSFTRNLSKVNPQVLLTAKVPFQEGDYVEIPLTVDGCPRAFVHRVWVDRLNRGTNYRNDPDYYHTSIGIDRLEMGPRRYQATAEQTVGPKDEQIEIRTLSDEQEIAAFEATADDVRMAVRFHVDAPPEAFGGEIRGNMIELDWRKTQQQRTFFNDRQVSVQLLEARGDGTLAIATTLDDFEVSLPAQGVTGRKDLEIRAQVAGETYRTASRAIVLDSDGPPSIIGFDVSGRVVKGRNIDVAIVAEDMSGIEAVRLALTARENAPLPEDTATDITGIEYSANAPTDIQQSIPTGELEAGTYYLQASVTDRVGNTRTTRVNSRFRPKRVVVAKPRPPAEPKPKPVIGTVWGTVMAGNYKPPRITVTLEAEDGKHGPWKPVQTGSGGRFRFENVPAGKYVLTAEGPVSNRLKSGTKPVEFTKREDYREIILPIK